MTILKLKGGLEGNITKMYLFEILGGIVFFGAIMMTFQESKGLSLSEIFYVKIGFVVSMALFEAPSGYFADIYGRKMSLIAGSIIELLGITLFAFANSFELFLIVDILMGLALAFYSGANSAIVYETLDAQNRTREYQKIWGDMKFYSMITMGISSIIGGFVADTYGLAYAVYINIPSIVLILFISLSLQEPPRVKVIAKKGFANGVIDTFKSNKALQLIVVYSGIIYIFNQSIYSAYQHYYKITGIDLVYFGLIHALFQVVSAYSSKYAYIVDKKLGKKNIAILLPFIVAISYILMGTFIGTWSFIFILLQQFVRGFREIIVSDYINQLVSSDKRATVLSMSSLLSKLMIAPMLLIWGFSLEYLSLREVLIIFGLVGLVIWIVLWIFIEKLGDKDAKYKEPNRFGSI